MLINELIEVAQSVGKLAYLVHQEGRVEYESKLAQAVKRQLEIQFEIKEALSK
jgi:hypothetical protein